MPGKRASSGASRSVQLQFSACAGLWPSHRTLRRCHFRLEQDGVPPLVACLRCWRQIWRSAASAPDPVSGREGAPISREVPAPLPVRSVPGPASDDRSASAQKDPCSRGEFESAPEPANPRPSAPLQGSPDVAPNPPQDKPKSSLQTRVLFDGLCYAVFSIGDS
jgi:hypothetical protein